ncbi:EAL domain-containing protein [Aestuariibacter sp. AA17]|uniref:EAL domain-containing protein n=1 Tax=Fluctibacter corallii TaxID=2984329 RepID=A0ABT3ABR0_9ALTE|nr:EAL domain-containing protein [Aestuariibacter sp. AA17]MCV2886116.1 EAL domain-containing protein [Aestuariibacter sp. AA17]
MSTNISSDVSQANERDSAGVLYANNAGSLLGNFCGALAMVFGFPDQQNQDFKFFWLLIFVCLLTLRASDFLYWRFRLKRANYDGIGATNRFIAGCVASGAMWSLYGIAMFDRFETFEFATLCVIITSLAGGAASILSGHRVAASLYVSVMVFPLSIFALLSEYEYRQLIGGLGILYGCVMLYSARKASTLTSSTIQLKNDNAQLVDLMHKEQCKLNQLNRELSQTNQKLNDTQNSLESEVRRRTERIAELSSLDPLTHIYNRSAFTEQLKMLFGKGSEQGFSLALLFIDLNGFKKINDTLGHKIGDLVLSEVAKRIGAFANDYHAGRWGGDEFLVALPYADKDTAISVATALQTRIAQPLDVLSNRLDISASIGIAMYPEHSVSELELIQFADFAMFEQKKAMNPQPRVFDQTLIQELKEAQDMRDGLQSAISNKSLFLCYQPIISAKNGNAVAFEALLRWRFSDKLVPPTVFIPLAEQSGLIKEIGSWVLHRACIDASQWQDHCDASVSVNVSVMQLLDDTFINDLDKALLTSGLAPDKLHLEITESMFADNKKKVVEQLDAIKQRGVEVSIDDFGTGYSSLSQLQNLSFDTIKIDRTFVANIKQGGEAIIRATIFIASEFGCRIVAEGVETEEDAALLRELGVEYLQGYLYSKPVEKEFLPPWFGDGIDLQRKLG